MLALPEQALIEDKHTYTELLTESSSLHFLTAKKWAENVSQKQDIQGAAESSFPYSLVSKILPNHGKMAFSRDTPATWVQDGADRADFPKQILHYHTQLCEALKYCPRSSWDFSQSIS